MPFTLKKAGLLSPKTLRNQIVKDFDNAERRNGDGVASTQDVFPLVELGSSTETYYTEHGGVGRMRPTGLASESPVTDLADLEEKDVTVNAYKSKVSPEKGVDTDLNSNREIKRLFEASATRLREEISMTRDTVAWRGDEEIDGLIGMHGDSAHPEIPSDNVITPATRYTEHDTATPHQDVMYGEYLLDEEGYAQNVGPVTAFMSPSAIYDMKLNADLANRFTGVETQGLTESQVANILEVDRVQKVRIKVPREDANGGYIDENGNSVAAAKDAKWDNILEPYNPDLGRTVRNIVINMPGQQTAMMPWFADRLAEHASNAPPGGQFAVDRNAGIMTQTWTSNDPVVSWLKCGMEIGIHITRGANHVVIQDC